MIAFCPIEVPLSLGIFIVVTALTKYVSLGSILGLISFFIQTVVFGELGLLNVTSHYKMEIYILSAVIMIMGIARHHENIRRLLNGNENKFSLKKKEEGKGSVSARIFDRGLCLPSDIKNTAQDMELIIRIVRKCFGR